MSHSFAEPVTPSAELLDGMLYSISWFYGSLVELTRSLGHTPRVLKVSYEEAQEIPDPELFDLFETDDSYYESLDRGYIARRMLIPGVCANAGPGVLIIEEGVQFCHQCRAPWPVFFMVHSSLWEAHASKTELLCIDCFEGRLGRKLTRADLNDAPLNSFPDTLALIPE